MTVLLHIAPEEPVIELVEFKTDVITARDGSEQRLSWRTKPRRSFDLTVVMDEPELREWRTHLFNRAVAEFHLPIWNEGMRTTSEAVATDTNVPIDLAYSDLAPGQLIMIETADESAREVHTLDTVTVNDFDTVDPLVNTYPAKSRVYPVELALMDDRTTIRRYPVNAGEMSIAAVVVAHRTLTGTGATINTYSGLPILDVRLVAPGMTSEVFAWDIRRADAGAVISQSSDRTFPAIDKPAQGVIQSPADRQWWRKFFTTLVGARKLCYVPTWRDDLIIAIQPSFALGAWTDLIVEDEPDYITEYEASLAHSHLQIEVTIAGVASIVQREVTAAVDNADGTITLTVAALTQMVVTRISFLELSRLGDVAKYSHYQSHSLVDFQVRAVQDTVEAPLT